MLTPTEARIYRFIVERMGRPEGVAPSYREIAAGLGLKTVSDIGRILDSIEGKGFIWRLKGRARAIEILRWQTEAANGWMPIETAPKNGAVLLLYARCVGYTASVAVIGSWHSVDLGWIASTFNSYIPSLRPEGISPTHWMPLPAPPETD